MPSRIALLTTNLVFAFVFANFSVALAQTTGAKSGAVEQTGAGAVPQDMKPAPLKLTDEQRARIRKVLTTTHTETETAKKSAQGQQEFKPAVGAQIPKGFNLDGLPQQLAPEIPILKQYGYVKFDNQILIVDPTSLKIVDQIPEG